MPLEDDIKIISAGDHVVEHPTAGRREMTTGRRACPGDDAGACAHSSVVMRLAADVTLVELLALERVEADLYRSTATFHDPQGLYGGQSPADVGEHKVLARTVGVEFLDAEPDSGLPTPARG